MPWWTSYVWKKPCLKRTCRKALPAFREVSKMFSCLGAAGSSYNVLHSAATLFDNLSELLQAASASEAPDSPHM